MKKTAIITVLLTASSFAFAELHPASRYVDIGYDFNVSASQNVTGVTDLLVEELNVNFTELADSMDDDGLVFNTSAGPGFHIDVSPGENQRYGIFLNAESSMRFATGKGIFELLGHGNAAGNLTSTAAAQGEMFMQTGINVKFKYGRVGWTVKPVYFVPVFYIPRTEMNITVITNDKDYMAKAYGSTNVNIYSNFNLGSAFDSDFKFLGAGELFSAVGDDISSILSSGGIALNLEAEYQLLNTLCAGVYTEVPIIAGSLGYKSTVNVSFDAEVEPIFNSVSSGEELKKDYSFKKELKETEKTSFKVRVPFRLGIEGAWRPFGDWCTFRPLLGFAVRNPWSDESSESSAFVEYSFGTEITALYVFKFNAETLYRNEVFTQRLGFGLNFRIFEIDAMIGSSSASFTKSWTVSGLNAQLGFHFGF